jgi:hypothetical protein
MKKIQLTQNRIALVDDVDFDILNQFKWCTQKLGNTYYATRHSPMVNGERHTILMHWEIIGKPPKGLMTDHRNGRGTDNQRKNLRFVTRRQNGQNQIHRNKSSQYPGVSWYKAYQKWRSRIVINGKSKHLGYFMDEYEAFNVYREAVELLGENVVGE